MSATGLLGDEAMAASLIHVLQQHAEHRAADPFATILGGDRRHVLTFGALWTESCRIAAALAATGVERGQTVIIMLRHGAGLYTSFIGTMLTGAIPSFMPFPTPKQQPDLFWQAHQALFAAIEPAAIIGYEDITDRLHAVAPPSTRILEISHLGLPASKTFSVAMPLPDEIALLQHSSGTTGLKKGVMLSHRAILTQIDDYAAAIAFGREDIIASWLPLYHDMGLIACFMLPLVRGAQVIHLDPFEWVGAPIMLLDEIERARATFVWLPNFAFTHIAGAASRSDRRWDLSATRAIINSSEPCRPESMEAFAHALAASGLKATAPQTCYAMAESVFAVTQSVLDRVPGRLTISRMALGERRVAPPEDEPDALQVASCGPPIRGVTVRIVDTLGRTVADDGVGEIQISGTSLYSGYNRLPELSARKLVDGWHHSGDLGFLHEGELYVTGRTDDLIIVRGRNYYAHDLEALASGIEGLKPGRITIFGVENAALGTAEAICLLEIEPGASIAAIRRAIKARIESGSGLVLSRVVAVAPGALNKTTSGKISREANRAAYLETAAARVETLNG